MPVRNLFMAIALTLGMMTILDTPKAGASHTNYLVEDADNNPNGTNSPHLLGVERSWILDGQPLSICSDFGADYASIPSGVRQAISDWEAVLPQSQFSQDCNAYNGKLSIKRRSLHAVNEWPCAPDAWGCAPQALTYDPGRGASYPTRAEVWLDELTWSYTNDGWRYMGVHEIGHHFGLDEAYIEPGYVCNSAITSVMNMGVRTTTTITGPCQYGSLTPTQRDIDLVQAFYYADSPNQFNLTLFSPDTVIIDFFDREWAESGYHFYAYRQTGGGWGAPVESFIATTDVGSKDHWVSALYWKGAGQPTGIYRFCVSGMTGIYGETGWQCTSSIHIVDHDPSCCSYIINVGPAAINLSAAEPRIGWSIAEVVNQGDHGDYIDLSLSEEPPLAAGCLRQIQLILPGSETTYFLAGEARLIVYRTLYECHSPAVPSFPAQTFTMTASHSGGGEPITNQGNNSHSVNKTLIIQ